MFSVDTEHDHAIYKISSCSDIFCLLVPPTSSHLIFFNCPSGQAASHSGHKMPSLRTPSPKKTSLSPCERLSCKALYESLSCSLVSRGFHYFVGVYWINRFFITYECHVRVFTVLREFFVLDGMNEMYLLSVLPKIHPVFSVIENLGTRICGWLLHW